MPLAAFRPIALASVLCPAALALESIETAAERLAADDVEIVLASAQTHARFGPWQTVLDLAYSDYDIDFQPASFDLLGEPTQIKTSTTAVNLSGRRPIGDDLQFDLALGRRDGFANFRSAWLDTYFDQRFAPLQGVPGHELYQPAAPKAASLSAGILWDYVPANARATATLTRIQDDVSPGYEIDFDGIRRGSLTLATTSLNLAFETVHSSRLRSRLAFSGSETSDREPRYAAELAANVALSERLALRATLGHSREAPRFEASFASATAEFGLAQGLSAVLQARGYRDSGEIEDAFLFTTAAPGLRQGHLGLGLRLQRDQWSGQLFYAYSKSNYDATNLDLDFFQNLYRDREWTLLRLALARSF